MKLFEKYNRLNITATILLFVAGSCAFYLLLNYILIRELDESLETEQQEIVAYIHAHNTLPEIIPTKDQYTTYATAARLQRTLFLNVSSSQHKEPLREVQFSVELNDKYYLIKVDKPLEETEALLQVIIAITVVMIALILLTSYIINRIVIRKLWHPFYQTIDTIKAWQLTDQQLPAFDPVDIEEFSLLNQSIGELAERIQKDYDSLKDYTGQAAHEMQTPLAVIRAKLDVLIQNDTALEQNAPHITDIEKAVQRLSRLHQSLLLLTKVENRQFALNETVRIDAVIKDKLEEYAEITESLRLNLSVQLQPLTILFHQQLTDILINNLLGNAIRYNTQGGSIDIRLQDNELTITNTSASPQLDGSRLFKRFYRPDAQPEGNGLGLSIVKQICDLGGFPVTYKFADGKHSFTISFHS